MSDINYRVLLIEDMTGMTLAIYRSLSKAGFKVDSAKTANSGLRKIEINEYDIILLDLGLPDLTGLEVCRRIRMDGTNTPIIVVTADDEIRSKINLFDSGANDYLTKPFNADELKARILACLRNKKPLAGILPLKVGKLKLDRKNRCFERDGHTIQLRKKECSILEFLMMHADSPVTRAGLVRYAWDNKDLGWTNTVDVHIKHLRDKIDRPFESHYVKTVHGIGYKLVSSGFKK